MGDFQADLEDAIKHTQAAVNKTPSDHPGLPTIFVLVPRLVILYVLPSKDIKI